jgi:hypothetical protein
MTIKLTIAAFALGLALPVAATTTATIKAPLPPCVANLQAANPKADATCAPAPLGAHIIPLAGSSDDGFEQDTEQGDTD